MNYGIFSLEGVLVNESGNTLTNFDIRAEKTFYEAEDEHTPGILRVVIWHRGQSCELDLDLKDPGLLRQILRAVPTCKVLMPKFSPHIEAYLLELPTNTEPERTSPPLCFRRNGFHKLTNGSYVFVAGDEVLGLPENREWAITTEAARSHLAWDETLTLAQAVRGLWAALEWDRKILLQVWGFTLLSAMRSVLIRMNVTTYPSCSITGEQGLGKTTTCQRFSLLYDDTWCPGRRWGELDAKSTYTATVEVISRYRDQVVLLDDLAKSISPVQEQQRKDLLAGVLRFACNDTDREKMDRPGRVVERFCTAGLIYTGELPLDNPSDISRTIMISIDEQLQGGEQRERTLAATAFRWFMLWMLPRVDEAVAGLAEELEHIDGDEQRLQKNRMMLLWALQQFLAFAQVNDAVTEEEADEMMDHASRLCDDMVDEQIRQSTRLKAKGNLSWYILDGLQRGTIQRIPEKSIKKDKRLPDHYYVHIKHDETLYITTEVLYRYFTEKAPVQLTSSRAMNKRLIEEGVIFPGKEGKSAAKKINGHRYLELHWSDLISAAGAAGAKRRPLDSR